MSGLFSKPDNSAQVAMQQKQLELQSQQQAKLDAQARDQNAAVLARSRASAGGGMRSLMASASLGNDTSTLGKTQA